MGPGVDHGAGARPRPRRCECNADALGLPGGGCCEGGGPAGVEVRRGPQLLKVCTKCILGGDVVVELLVDAVDDEFFEHDYFGAVELEGWTIYGLPTSGST